MAVSTVSLSVAGTEVALNAQGTAALDLLVKNTGANPAALGPSGVTLSGGFELAAGESAAIRVDGDDELFAIADAISTTTLKVLRT